MQDRPPDHSTRTGPDSAPAVNPRLRPQAPPEIAPAALFEGLVRADRASLARSITLVESGRRADRSAALDLLDRCMARAGRAIRIGISGAPGVGKSTLIDVLGVHWLESGHRVAVLAVDPSSERSRGSILGDKTRMGRLASDERAFIRPTPAAGALGGVARTTRAAITICEAAGYDTIIVETVGVGQSETDVRHMVDTFLLLAQSGAGDELQGIKRGIVEAADVIAVAKADGENEARALAARSVLESAMRLLPTDPSGWKAPVVACSALTGAGLGELRDRLAEHREHILRTGSLQAMRAEQALRWMRDEVLDSLRDRFSDDPAIADRWAALRSDVAGGSVHPYRAAEALLASIG